MDGWKKGRKEGRQGGRARGGRKEGRKVSGLIVPVPMACLLPSLGLSLTVLTHSFCILALKLRPLSSPYSALATSPTSQIFSM